MENYKLDTGAGDNIDSVVSKAKEIAKQRNCIVEFDFNGIKCLVSEKTVEEWLIRDFKNAFVMDWKQVGDDCKMQYEAAVEVELYTRKLAAAKERKKREAKQEKEYNKQQVVVNAITSKSKYQYKDGMNEISGFGGGYEKACRDMVTVGMDWLDAHPNADISYKEIKGVYGLTTGESDDCKEMEKAMLAVNDGCSGAQMQAAKSHIMYAHKNGWEKYVQEMSKPRERKTVS